jgi:hypothetical protein
MLLNRPGICTKPQKAPKVPEFPLPRRRPKILNRFPKCSTAPTWRDVISPLTGGWGRLARDWQQGVRREIGGVPGAGLNLSDMLDPALLAALPVTLFR